MDINESIWILEFLLRQTSLDDQTLTSLIRTLPIPKNHPKLTKTLIIRQLQSHIQKNTISQQTLVLLEQIEQLDQLDQLDELDVKEPDYEVSESMKAAYTTLAMQLTAKLMEKIEVGGKVECFGAVKRFWSDRVGEMERCGVRLVHDDVVGWVRDVEAGVLDVDVVRRFGEVDVVECVGRYVDEVLEKMGRSFLELACEAVLSDCRLGEVLGLDGGLEVGRGANDGDEASRAHEDEVSNVNNQNKDSAPTQDAGGTSKGNEALNARVRPHKRVVSRRGRGAKIVDTVETCYGKYTFIPSPEVREIQEALKASSLELRAAVKDPLPEALRFAESLKVRTSGENEAPDHVGGNTAEVNDKAPSSSHDRKGKAIEVDGDDGISKDLNRTKPSLFERNHTAHTTEWSDTIDSSEGGSPPRPHLPTPQKSKTSPLNIYKMEKLVRQRKRKRWTILEEDTLRTGVQKYGRGNWKLILSMYRDIFEDRTEVDLKDKWRNLTR